MRRPGLLLLPLVLTAATPYDWGTKLRLDNGTTSLKVFHAQDGVETSDFVVLSLPLGGATYQKVTIWPTRYTAFTGETACPAPCAISMPRQYGAAKYRAEFYNSSDALLRTSEWYDVPQLMPAPLTTFKMPLEIIGFAPYSLPVRVTTDAGASNAGTIRLYARTHRVGYPTKARVRVNGGAWMRIVRPAATLIGQTANYTFGTSMQFGQSVLEWTMDLPAGLVQGGGAANTVEWQYWQEDHHSESGYRVLKFNFLQPDKTVSSTTVSGSTATLTSTAHGYSSGDSIRIEAYPGKGWQLNGDHTITVTGANTFTFSVTGVTAGTFTYTGVKVAKLMVPLASFTQDDVTTWTAPAGASASAGAAAFAANNLREPQFNQVNGGTITASCSNCHAQDARDLKFFNYSNWSNVVRSQFHGLSETAGKNIAAYVRSHPSSAPGRPWNPPYQPCPNADVVSAYDWPGACTIDDVLTHEMGMYEQLFGASIDAADFSPTRSDIHFRTTRTTLQLLDWNDWLPHIHPKDWWNSSINQTTYPYGYYPTSTQSTYIAERRAYYTGFCPGAGCAARIAGESTYHEEWGYIGGSRLAHYAGNNGYPICSGKPADSECPNRVPTLENKQLVAIYSAGQLPLVKQWEMFQEFGLAGMASSYFPRGGPENGRIGSPTGLMFNSSPNLIKAKGPDSRIDGILDGNEESERLLSMVWYHMQAIISSQLNKCCPAQINGVVPIDVGYTYGYFKDLSFQGFVKLPLTLTLWVQQNFMRWVNGVPGPSQDDWQPSQPSAQNISAGYLNLTWGGLPAEDRLATRSAIAAASAAKWTAIFCGDETNGTASAFTPTMWRTSNLSEQTRMPQTTNLQDAAGFPIASIFWHLMTHGKAVGVAQATVDRLATCGAAIWSGPNATISGGIASSGTANVTLAAIPEGWPTANHQVQIDSEKLTCSFRSGSTLSGCLRGQAGTTAATHASGAIAQIVIRWSKAQNSTCSLDTDGVTVINCGDIEP